MAWRLSPLCSAASGHPKRLDSAGAGPAAPCEQPRLLHAGLDLDSLGEQGSCSPQRLLSYREIEQKLAGIQRGTRPLGTPEPASPTSGLLVISKIELSRLRGRRVARALIDLGSLGKLRAGEGVGPMGAGRPLSSLLPGP